MPNEREAASPMMQKFLREAIDKYRYHGITTGGDCYLEMRSDELLELFMKVAREVREECAKIADKRRDDRFKEHGTREDDTNAGYYTGKLAEIHEALDEEDEEIAAAIRQKGR